MCCMLEWRRGRFRPPATGHRTVRGRTCCRAIHRLHFPMALRLRHKSWISKFSLIYFRPIPSSRCTTNIAWLCYYYGGSAAASDLATRPRAGSRPKWISRRFFSPDCLSFYSIQRNLKLSPACLQTVWNWTLPGQRGCWDRLKSDDWSVFSGSQF